MERRICSHGTVVCRTEDHRTSRQRRTEAANYRIRRRRIFSRNYEGIHPYQERRYDSLTGSSPLERYNDNINDNDYDSTEVTQEDHHLTSQLNHSIPGSYRSTIHSSLYSSPTRTLQSASISSLNVGNHTTAESHNDYTTTPNRRNSIDREMGYYQERQSVHENPSANSQSNYYVPVTPWNPSYYTSSSSANEYAQQLSNSSNYFVYQTTSDHYDLRSSAFTFPTVAEDEQYGYRSWTETSDELNGRTLHENTSVFPVWINQFPSYTNAQSSHEPTNYFSRYVQPSRTLHENRSLSSDRMNQSTSYTNTQSHHEPTNYFSRNVQPSRTLHQSRSLSSDRMNPSTSYTNAQSSYAIPNYYNNLNQSTSYTNARSFNDQTNYFSRIAVTSEATVIRSHDAIVFHGEGQSLASTLTKNKSKKGSERYENHFWRNSSSGVIRCVVCNDDNDKITRQGTNVFSARCGHLFCTTCLEELRSFVYKCPKCKRRIRCPWKIYV